MNTETCRKAFNNDFGTGGSNDAFVIYRMGFQAAYNLRLSAAEIKEVLSIHEYDIEQGKLEKAAQAIFDAQEAKS